MRIQTKAGDDGVLRKEGKGWRCFGRAREWQEAVRAGDRARARSKEQGEARRGSAQKRGGGGGETKEMGRGPRAAPRGLSGARGL